MTMIIPALGRGMEQNVLKIILVGSSGVGKTSLLQRYTDGGFTESSNRTIGVDFEIKPIQVQGHDVTLQMWDTAGQEKLKNIVSPFYRNSHGVIVVYDITNMDSFNDIESWFLEVQFYNPDALGLLVGNKRDLMHRRVVDPQMAVSLANRLGVAYVESSAKDCTNVCELFTAIAETLMQHRIATRQASPEVSMTAGKVNVLSGRQQKSCSRSACF